MLENAAALLAAAARGPLVVATVIGADGSTPRELGTSMAVDATDAVVGSISGGCVEGAVYEACLRVRESGVAEISEFGFSDADAFAVGLSCGGRIRVLVHPLDLDSAAQAWVRPVLEDAAEGRSAALELALDGASPGRLLPVPVGAFRADEATRELGSRCEGEPVSALRMVKAAPARMIIFGAVDFSAALADAARLLGYRVTVCDARALFATAERFAGVEVVAEWPDRYLASTEVDERTVLAVLTHDAKFDIPVLRLALSLPVAYVGAMGSRRSHERRLELLRDAGVAEEAIARLHSPIGLDLGAESPQEVAVSILAEVIRERTGASGVSLWETKGRIHAGRGDGRIG